MDKDIARDLYGSIMKGDLEKVKEIYMTMRQQEPLDTLTVCKDTVLHIAIYMGKESIAREILEKHINDPDTLLAQNVFGDTILHEAATTDMTRFVEDLLKREPKLLSMANNQEEMPLFKAAHFGQTKMFELLAKKVDETKKMDKEEDRKDVKRHLHRKDGTTILHIAILAEFFDLALTIAKRYPDLLEAKDANGMIGLQLLSSNPSAFKSGSSHGLLKRLIYCCTPSENADRKDDSLQEGNLSYVSVQVGNNENRPEPRRSMLRPTYTVCVDLYSMITSELRKMNGLAWNLFSQGWPVMGRIWNEKKKHESALRLARLLIRKDISWELSSIKPDAGKINIGITDKEKGDKKQGQADKKIGDRELQIVEWKPIQRGGGGVLPNPQASGEKIPPTSLLIATSNGIVEIVEEILEVYPQAVEHVNKSGINILHVAIKHRQKKIFHRVKKMEIPMTRLVRRIDDKGYTILHHVGDMDNYSGGTTPGPALQLQEELRWFDRVKKIIPPHYAIHRSEKEKGSENGNETALEYFKRTHAGLLKEAQDWLKRTSESCSTVAVLIATVAFAAAYTVPGGPNQDTGLPILLHDPFFLVFTIMDVLSLASSLTSVVMFLSILTSPFQMEDFRSRLPRKLTLGFTFLFLSVAVTMLAFAATILLIIHLNKRWTTLLIYTVAFLPVTIFALLQFPLYVAFTNTLKSSFRVIKNVFPQSFLTCLLRFPPFSICKTHRN